MIEFFNVIEKSINEYESSKDLKDIVEDYSYLVETDDLKSDDILNENLSAAINLFKILSPTDNNKEYLDNFEKSLKLKIRSNYSKPLKVLT